MTAAPPLPVASAPILQLSRGGVVLLGSEEVRRGLRAQFDLHHVVRLPQLLDRPLLERVQRNLLQSRFSPFVHQGIGRDIRLEDNPTSGLLLLLANSPALCRIIEDITSCDYIGSFSGHLYRMMPGGDHYDSWHDDAVQERVVGMSINLSGAVYSGGIFHLRDRATGRILCQAVNTGFGDAILFRLSPQLEHCVTPVDGAFPKTAFAGWFRSVPPDQAPLRGCYGGG